MSRWRDGLANMVRSKRARGSSDYGSRLDEERRRFDACLDTNELPEIFSYWSTTYVQPMLKEVGAEDPQEFFAKYLVECAAASQEPPVFVSLGAGNCDIEVRVAELIRERGLTRFSIECVDINEAMLSRGRQLAEEQGLSQHITTTVADLNDWKPSRRYAGIVVNQALHHVVELENLLGAIKRALAPNGYLLVSDMIGRNGHMRWPEALDAVHHFWRELPETHRYHHQLKRYEELYENWDCSTEGFEGIRAQDILPLLMEHFEFYIFIPFGNVIDVFVDRGFGPNFDATSPVDRDLIDRIHAFDEEGFREGRLTPTHLVAALTVGPPPERFYSRGLDPARCIRRP